MCSSRVGEQYGDHESDGKRVCVSEYNTVKVRQRIAVGYQPSHVAINCEIFYTYKPKGSITITQNVAKQFTKYTCNTHRRLSFCPTGSPSHCNRMNMIL